MNQVHSEIEWEAKDGAVNLCIYESEKIKILWVLREPNGKNFDFMKYLQDPRVYPKWKRSYGLILKTSHAILNDSTKDELRYPYPKDVPALMSRIALVNIKKTGGGAISNHKKLLEYALNHADSFKKQIQELAPDLIILAGTSGYVSPDLIDNIHIVTGKPTHIIKTYHPNQRVISHQKFTQYILNSLQMATDTRRIPD
jgi:hypothetical protein